MIINFLKYYTKELLARDLGKFSLGKWDLGHWDWDLVTGNGNYRQKNNRTGTGIL